MKIITANLNGIRAAHRKGFFDWLPSQKADVICIQETKAQTHQLTDEILKPTGYSGHFHDAEKKGYSGVALYLREEPDQVICGLGWEDFDKEGRFIQADFGNLSVSSLYLPSGSSSEERQAKKFEFMDRFYPELERMSNDGRDYIICGDWNIAHKEIDLKNWKANQKNSGFLPEEREWLSRIFDDLGYIDGFREINQTPDQYTWWSNRGQAWAKNVGWRIDYQILSPGLKGSVRTATIYKEERFSDHAPLIMTYDLRHRSHSVKNCC